jgi:hypothetical protein
VCRSNIYTNLMQNPTKLDIEAAVEELAHSKRGRQALADLLAFLDNGGISLDSLNQRAVATLLMGVWGVRTQPVIEAIRDDIERRTGPH